MPSESSVAISQRPQPGTPADAPAEDGHGRDELVGEPEGELPLDVTFELLKNYRRRVVLRYLETQPTTTLSDLAEHVAARENGKPIRELTSTERKRAYISLYQCHLPKLDDAGVADFDSDRGTVVRNDTADHFKPYLDRVSAGDAGEPGPAWPRYYFAVALAGGVLLAAELALVGSVSFTQVVAGLLAGAVAAVAVVHARHESPTAS